MLFPGLWRVTQWRAQRLSGAGRQDDARAVVERFALRHPEYEEGWILVGQFSRELGLQAEEQIYRDALALHPKSTLIASALADVLIKHERFGEARELGQRLVGEHPDRSNGYVVEFAAAVGVQDWFTARSLVPKIEERLEDAPIVRQRCAKSLLYLPEGRRRAASLLDGLARRHPRSTFMHVYLGVALEDVDPPRAAKEFRLAEVLSGLDSDAFQDLVMDMQRIVGDLQAPPADDDQRDDVHG